jgi:predicted small lipoprotein YifL
MTRRALLLALVAALGLPLAACGRKGDPEPPKDVDPKAPRRYPTR